MAYSIIGDNQAVSAMVYSMSIANLTRLPHEFLAAQADRITRAYLMGETIEMISDELQLRYSLRRPPATKTPRALAIRVVKA